jgi:diketogulonate reductase-like aldo/keto reductase
MSVFGLGTWRIGEHSRARQAEIDAIHYALEHGITLIDTAEMYGEGGAEKIIGEAIRGRRNELFVVSKVYPHNASRDGVVAACERSLRRLGCDSIDLFLLHWPGSVPLIETFDAFHQLQNSGKIRDFGVSNFDFEDLQEIPADDQHKIGCNQVFYNLAQRQAEWAVTPWCREHSVPVMAYSPLDQASSLLQSISIAEIASRHSATVAQIALAWLLHQPNTVVIPKSVRTERIKENLGALDIRLSEQDLVDLNVSYPAPDRPVRLGMR